MNLRVTRLFPSSSGLQLLAAVRRLYSLRHNLPVPPAAIAWLPPCLLLLHPSPALAVQIHGGAEGLVSHQIGHLLFLTGMTYLLWRIRQRNLQDAGWPSFRLFLCCIILWNITTMTGHWLDKMISADHFLRDSGMIISFRANGPLDLLFYATRLDHLLLVPAFLFLLLALQRWSRHI